MPTPEVWLFRFGTIAATFLLVIVIIMAAITPMIDRPVLVDVPFSRTTERSPNYEHDVYISVRAAGPIFIGAEAIAPESLGPRLRAARVASPDPYHGLRLQIDRNIPFGTVRRIAIAARDAGYASVTFLVRVEMPEAAAGDRFTFDDCWDCETDFAAYAWLTLLFFGPVGALLMRKHIADASGFAKFAGLILQALAILSTPILVLLAAGLLLRLVVG